MSTQSPKKCFETPFLTVSQKNAALEQDYANWRLRPGFQQRKMTRWPRTNITPKHWDRSGAITKTFSHRSAAYPTITRSRCCCAAVRRNNQVGARVETVASQPAAAQPFQAQVLRYTHRASRRDRATLRSCHTARGSELRSGLPQNNPAVRRPEHLHVALVVK